MLSMKEITPKYDPNYPPNEANTEDAVVKVISSTLKNTFIFLRLGSDFY